MSRRLDRLLRARLHPDERGFSLLETVIAITVIFASVTALTYAVSAGFGYTALARERQAATGIANQLIEQIRALAWVRLTQGLSSSDLSDPNILVCPTGEDAVYRFKSCTPPPAGTVQAVGSKIVHTPNLPNECSTGPACPLVPHQGTVSGSGYPTTFSWSAYLTNEDPKRQPYVATVLVSWTKGRVNGVAKFIQTETMIYNPQGCGGVNVHPFAGPCTAYHEGSTTVTAGAITIRSNLTALQGNSFDSVSLVPQSATASAGMEQASVINATATQGGVEKLVSGVTSKFGEVAISTAADTNPTTTAGAYAAVPSLTPTNGTWSVAPGTNTTLTVANGSGATGSVVGATAPTSTGTNPCPLVSGLAVAQQTDALSCAAATSRPGAAMMSTLNLTALTPSLGTANMAQLGVPAGSTPAASAFIDRKASAQDSLSAVAARRFGTIELLGTPSALTSGLPSGWTTSTYLIRVTSYADQVSSEAGASTLAPNAGVTGSPTITYWNGSGFSSVSGATLNAAGSITVGNLTAGPQQFGTGASRRWVCVYMIPAGSFTRDGANTLALGTPVVSSKASMGSPLKGSVRYVVDVLATNPGATCPATPSLVPVVDLTMNVDLGTVQVKTTYKPAPTGG